MVLELLKPLGDEVTNLSSKVLGLIPTTLLESETTAKITSILISAIIIWAFLHFAGSLKKITKIVIVGLLVLLIISVLVTFTS